MSMQEFVKDFQFAQTAVEELMWPLIKIQTEPVSIETAIGTITSKYETVDSKTGEAGYVFYLDGVKEQSYKQFEKMLVEKEMENRGWEAPQKKVVDPSKFTTVQKWNYISDDGRYEIIRVGSKGKTYKLLRDEKVIATGNTHSNGLRFTQFKTGLVESVLKNQVFGRNLGDFFRYMANYDIK